jgi:hypothetical protein
MIREISKRCLGVIIGFVIFVLACKPPKMTNAPTIPDAYYGFSKSKYQVLNILDSIISNSQFFFREESEEPEHILLNLKNKGDTITFVLLYKQGDLNGVKLNDSSMFFVMHIGKYINRKSEETPLYPKIDSLQRKIYLNKLDSLIITPLRQRISEMQ